MSTSHHAAELASLVLTAPTLILAFAVLWIWGPAAKAAVRQGMTSSQDWFLIGVCLGFVGSFIDNLFWAFPWTASFLGLDSQGTLFEMGVYFNIPFRQGLGILAAFCHLKAAETSFDGEFIFLNRALAICYLVAGIVLVTLLVLK